VFIAQIGAAGDDGLGPRKINAERRGGRIEKDHSAGWRAWHQRACHVAISEKSGIDRVQAIDILAWRNAFDHAARIEPAGQRQLQQDSVDGGIGIKQFDQGEQLRLARRRGKIVLDRMKPAGLRGLAFGFDIDLTCRIVADENDREARLQSLRGERAGIFGYPRNHLLRRAPAVDERAFAPDGKRTPFPADVVPVCARAMASP
jgi:hypothetical protein